MIPSPTKIKTVYSFVGATIMLDLNTPMGKTIVQQIHPAVCQYLRQGNPEFNQLYSQVERENTAHVLGTGMSESTKGITDAYLDWLKSRGIDSKDKSKEGKHFVFSGDGKDPQNGLSFAFTVYIYFDFEE